MSVTLNDFGLNDFGWMTYLHKIWLLYHKSGTMKRVLLIIGGGILYVK
jgi:hypothetical protein